MLTSGSVDGDGIHSPVVSWSEDGRTLVAGGGESLTIWPDGGRGPGRLLEVSNRGIMAIKPLPRGGVAGPLAA